MIEVIDSIPWVRCASGNVSYMMASLIRYLAFSLLILKHIDSSDATPGWVLHWFQLFKCAIAIGNISRFGKTALYEIFVAVFVHFCKIQRGFYLCWQTCCSRVHIVRTFHGGDEHFWINWKDWSTGKPYKTSTLWHDVCQRRSFPRMDPKTILLQKVVQR